MKRISILALFVGLISIVQAQETRSLPIPSKIAFCGKSIDLTRYDMRERFDREQLTFMYWHSTSILLVKRANRYFPIIEPILKANGVPDDFKYLAVIESNLVPTARSGAGAAGLWQFLGTTAKEYGLEVSDQIDERYHVEKSTAAACRYLKDAYQKYGSWTTVAASYNAGQGRISAELQKQQVEHSFDMYLNAETSRYVFRILAAKQFLTHPSDFGYCLRREHFYHTIRTKTITVNTSVPDWTAWAKQQGISYAQLKDFNPWLRDRSLTNARGTLYAVKIPLRDDLVFDLNKVHIHNKAWVEE